MKKIIFLLFLASCASSNTLITQNDYAKMSEYKVLLCVFKSRGGQVIFENPVGTKQYVCTDRDESKRWNKGDTLFIRYKGRLLSEEDAKTIAALQLYKTIRY